VEGEHGGLLCLVIPGVHGALIGVVDLDAIHKEDAPAKSVVSSSERFIAVEAQT
jgi:hypothetical protein